MHSSWFSRFFVIKHYEKQRTRDYFYASLIIALAPFIRYIGLALVALFLGYTIYFIFAFRVNKRSSVVKYLLLSTISFLPIGLYLLRNYRDTGTLTGERLPANLTIFGNLNSVLEVFVQDINLYFRILFLISVIFYVIILFNKNRIGNTKNIFPSSFILILFFLYTCFILYTTTQAKVDPIGTRYFAPLYPLLLIFTFIGLETILSSELPELVGFSNIRLFRIGILSLICISLLANIIGFNAWLDNISKNRFVPVSHTEAGFNLSPTSLNLNKYFHRILDLQDQIHVVVSMDFQLPYDKYFGPDMFYRESILRSYSTNRFAFGDIQVYDDYWGTIRDFSLSMQIDGDPKLIKYHNTPRIRNDLQLALYLIEITEEYNADNITLIVHNENLVFIGDDVLLPTIDEHFDLVSLESIDPYHVYELTISK